MEALHDDGSESAAFARLVREACHDLRTPLATAYGFARTLERLGELDDQQRRYVGLIVASSEDLSRQIDALAVLSRIEVGAFTVRPRECDLAHVAAGAAAEADHRVGEGRSVICVEAPDSIDIITDPDHALAALAGLAEAGMRFQPSLEEISLEAGPDYAVRIGPLSDEAAGLLSAPGRDLRVAAALAGLQAIGARAVGAGDSLSVSFVI